MRSGNQYPGGVVELKRCLIRAVVVEASGG
jgi:hypothetical protein